MARAQPRTYPAGDERLDPSPQRAAERGERDVSERRRAAVVAIGDELLRGDCVDSNSGEIARRLEALGIEVEQFLVLGDDRRALARAFAELCSAHAIVVATGGLGPTLDDVTREAAADAARVPLDTDDAVLAELETRWKARGQAMPVSNARQAQRPAGAQLMPNPRGTAPGFRVWIEGGMLAALPGPPGEMRHMLERELVPWLESTCGRGEGLAAHSFFLSGLAESAFADRAGDWMERGANPRMGVTAHFGVLRVTLRARADTERGARELLAARCGAFRERFAAELFSEDEPRLELALGKLLIERDITVATAESCTGGLVARLLTDAPGISAVFREGWITYTDEAKTARLGVPRELLAEHGAVSGPVAAAMAAGAARSSGARAALSTTGIAGPTGGTTTKPVGLVWLGLALDGAVETRELRLAPVGRDSIRLYASYAALELLRRALARRARSD
jgi:nicotinamide-nucleotide amidase